MGLKSNSISRDHVQMRDGIFYSILVCRNDPKRGTEYIIVVPRRYTAIHAQSITNIFYKTRDKILARASY